MPLSLIFARFTRDDRKMRAEVITYLRRLSNRQNNENLFLLRQVIISPGEFPHLWWILVQIASLLHKLCAGFTVFVFFFFGFFYFWLNSIYEPIVHAHYDFRFTENYANLCKFQWSFLNTNSAKTQKLFAFGFLIQNILAMWKVTLLVFNYAIIFYTTNLSLISLFNCPNAFERISFDVRESFGSLPFLFNKHLCKSIV